MEVRNIFVYTLQFKWPYRILLENQVLSQVRVRGFKGVDLWTLDINHIHSSSEKLLSWNLVDNKYSELIILRLYLKITKT